ncbi:MAC/perforin domain-containing protein [Porphyromonas somerae]|uniref:MAC/perforin domain-containing protein n=1 Tax=Porphyromonas somerae TaxID=322095 RepID=UPI002A7FA3AC|nr:MAC/perforin domain-containing protein [Porphyromonas somerae]MDY3883893.1 MAC/perforin domain-containing protein [Porphyromonas somerae]
MKYTIKNNHVSLFFALVLATFFIGCHRTNTELIEWDKESQENVQLPSHLRSYSQQTSSPDEKREMAHKRDSILLDFSNLVSKSSFSAYSFDLGILGFGYDPGKGFGEDHPSLLLESNQNATQPVINMMEVSSEPYSLFYPTNVYIGESVFTTSTSTEIVQSLYDYFGSKVSKIGSKFSINISKIIGELSTDINSSYKKTLNLANDNYYSISLAFGSQRVLTRSLSLTIPNKRLRTPEKDIDPRFSINSYTKSASELINDYGPFVLKSYTSGGKVSINAVFGNKNNKTNSKVKEETHLLMNVTAKGVFGALSTSNEQNDSTSISVFNEIKNEYTFSDLSATSIGGSPVNLSSFPIISNDVKSLLLPSIDLATWSQSVEGRDVLVKINDSGLVPISDLIPEINISKRVKDFIEKGIDYNPFDYKGEPIIVNKRDGYVYIALISRFGDLFLLDKAELPQMGYEWWLYYKPQDCPIKVCYMDYYRCEFIEQLHRYNIIDLTSSNNTNKPTIRYCKIKDTPASSAFTYILINNKTDRKKIALRVLDAIIEESGLDPIDEIEYITNVHGYDIYAL